MADRHVLNVSPRTVQWGVWDARLEPVLRIKSGDLVEIHTISGEPEDLPPGNVGVAPEQLEVHAKCRRGPGPHFLTGPVWVQGAEPGDALEEERYARLRSYKVSPEAMEQAKRFGLRGDIEGHLQGVAFYSEPYAHPAGEPALGAHHHKLAGPGY